ncbi:hypothetical protein BASA81_011637 [Batrachochytrium salamandrivorans]|nr:hypothetical protein BASA81_011637 [Batrachochytrium salamandrivorans]
MTMIGTQQKTLTILTKTQTRPVGEQSMDRVARNLGGKIVLPIAFNIIPSYLGSPEWPKRHAALRCISAIGEGCIKLMTAELEKVVGLVIPHLADPHPRVRHAACNAIGQMCTDFAPKIQDKYYDVILTHLVPVMDDVQHPRVQTYAAAALVNFAEQAKKECISPYLELIIPKLLSLLDSGKMFSKEQAITSLATIADSAGDQFSQFYPSIMSVLMRILNLDDSLELRSLVGKTLECSSLVVSDRREYRQRYQLPLNLLKTPIALFLADGQPASKSHVTHESQLLKVTCQDHIEITKFYVSSIKYPVILGLDWLRRHNPRINWDDLTIVFQSEYCQDNCTATQPVTCHSVEMTTCSTSRTDPDKLTSQVYPYIGGNEQQISDFPEELTIEYADVFSKSNANKLPAHSEFDFGIDLEPGFHPPHGKVYSLTPKETQVMATYVQEQLDKNFIRPSTSPAAAPCFFVAKKDGDLRPVQDYRGLNAGTIKKRYPLPLISDLLRDLSKGSIFTTLDLRSAYNLIRIKKGDE